MCGFAGFIDFSGQSTGAEVLEKMTASIAHRGPDDSGIFLYPQNGYEVGMGFRRLSILDLSASGHQPMLLEDGSMVITFNGEVYNFAEIREELQSLGYTFHSGSDTEVILKSFKQWGLDCVSRFIGMFAIALLDIRAEKMYLIRDRAGVKPLFYYHKNGLFLFGSELKAFHQHSRFEKEINYTALGSYFQFGHVRNPLTIFEHTWKVAPGSYVVFDLKSQELKEETYWNAYSWFNRPKLTLSVEETIAETHRLLKSAFQYRMVSDVPVGVFLSGGYDSSCVAAILQSESSERIKTFTIGFEESSYNEAPYARAVANHLGTDHTEITCSADIASDILTELPEVYDEPFGDSSAIPTILVSRAARAHVKVALSADGSDELFGGYPRYFRTSRLLANYDRIPGAFKSAGRWILNQLPLHSNNPLRHNRMYKLRELLNADSDFARFLTITEPMTFEEARLLISSNQSVSARRHEFPGIDPRWNDKFATFQAGEFWDALTDDMLQKVDRASMSVSLEAREPFLDHRLFEFVAQVPTQIKVKDNISKYLVREITHQYLPRTIMERPKMGFGIPVHQLSKTHFKEIIDETLLGDSVRTQGILDPQVIKEIHRRFYEGEQIDFQRFWFVLMFQLWANRWL